MLTLLICLAATSTPGGDCTESPQNLELVAGPFSLEKVNGNKVVSRFINSALHRVHEENQRIYYSSSQGGLSWTPIVQIGVPTGFGCIDPAIAVAGGTLGVVFIRNPSVFTDEGDLYYTHRAVNGGTWSTPTHIGWGGSPSIEGLGSDMHVVTSASTFVSYLRFPATSPPAFPSVGEPLGLLPICALGQTSLPAISLARFDECTIEPVQVRIGHFLFHDCTACGYADPLSFGVVVWERNGVGSIPWTTIFEYGGTTPDTQVGGVALSMDTNRATGTTVLAYSEVRQATNSTRLVRITRSGVATQTTFSSLRTIIDVNVRDTRCTGGVQVRYAATELTGGSHHETKVATGLWLDGQGAPSFSMPETVSTAARSAQAIFWGKYSPGAFSSVRTLFEEQQGALYGLMTDHAICTTNPLALTGLSCGGFPPCSLPALRSAHL